MVVMGDLDLTSLFKANEAFQKALQEAKSWLEKSGAIQHFEFTYELAWKSLKRVLVKKGVLVKAPRDTFREAAALGLIDDPKVWFSFLETRNETVHTYDEETAEEVFAQLPLFGKEVAKLCKTLAEL